MDRGGDRRRHRRGMVAGEVEMITGIEGRPGSGKSYYAVVRLYESLARGKTVYTNMRNVYIHKIAWAIYRNYRVPRKRILEKFKIIDVWEIERLWKEKIENADIYFDEVMTCWLSRDWSKMDRGLIEWFSQHRKYRVNFTYVAQSIDRVDSTLKDMTQEFISIRNFSYYKIGPFRLPQVFLICKYAEDRKLLLKREWEIPVKRFYGYYDSWALFPTKKPQLAGGNVVALRGGLPEGMGATDQEIPTEADMRASADELMLRYFGRTVRA